MKVLSPRNPTVQVTVSKGQVSKSVTSAPRPLGSVLVRRYLGSVSVIFFLLEPTLKTYLASLLCFLLLQKMESLAQRGPCPSLWERYAYSRKTGERKKFLQSTRKSFILGSTGARELLDRVSHAVSHTC